MANDARILPERVTREQIAEAPITQLVLEKRFVGKLKIADTTPDVPNVEHWDAQNVGAVTVTNFLRGQDGQHLYIRGDGQTTLQHGTSIFTNTGANKLLANNLIYHLVRRAGKWYEVA